MRTYLLAAALVLLASSAAFAAPTAALLISDSGSLAPEELHAVRSLATEELRANHIEVSPDPRFEQIRPADAQVLDAMRADGLLKLYVLVVNGRLGNKIPFTMQERDPLGNVVASASLSANGIEEADMVVPRLTRAVLAHQTADQAATVDTVTSIEAQPFNKKFGERFWTVGFNIPTYSGAQTSTIFGLSLGYHYEAPFWRLGVTGEFGGNKGLNSEFFGLEAAWLPFATEVTPYLGGGFGFGATQSGSGVAFKAEAGVEFLRLRTVRLIAGMDLFIPAFRQGVVDGGTPGVYPLVHVRFMF
jgi:hypothetical protein